MRLELTEILACPACGPDRGFVAFVDSLANGIILQGRLDCPECERRHRVVDGVLYLADARPPATDDSSHMPPRAREVAAALLGVPSGPEVILVGPGLYQLAAGLAADRTTTTLLCLTTAPEVPPDRVHPIVCGDTRILPLRSGRVHAAVLRGGETVEPAEIVRVLAPGSRIVILEPGPELADFQALDAVGTLAADSRAAVLVASPLSAV